MKCFRVLLVLLLVFSSSQMLKAQAGDRWVEVSLDGDGFKVKLPNSQVAKSHETSFEQFKVAGRVYTAKEDGVDYAVWSLVDQNYSSEKPPEPSAYLDACADLVWESLLKPLRDQLPKEPAVRAFMAYQRVLETKEQRGREYAITLGNQTGLAHFYVAGPRIYVLTVINPQANFVAIQRFLNSVVSKAPNLPVATTIVAADPRLNAPPPSSPSLPAGLPDPRFTRVGRGSGVGPEEGSGVGGGDEQAVGAATATAAEGVMDYNKAFSGKEVTQKARILAKPEPQYTESARKYAVTGTVVLRAVFSGSGEITKIRVLSGLPHGLTTMAVDAAKAIRFTPAQKDGRDVSMWFQLEYNFNLY